MKVAIPGPDCSPLYQTPSPGCPQTGHSGWSRCGAVDCCMGGGSDGPACPNTQCLFVPWLCSVLATCRVLKGQICLDNCKCCHTERDVTNQPSYLTH